MRPILFIPLLIALPLIASAGPGQNCYYGAHATGEYEITDGTAANTYYADDRGYPDGGGFAFYQESNGIFTQKLPGAYAEAAGDRVSDDLQRGGSTPYIPEEDPCFDAASDIAGPDSFIF